MVISVGNFNIRESEGMHKFDLHVTYLSTGKKTAGNVVEKPFAFGITFGKCMQIIVQETMNAKFGKLTLDEYKEAYEQTTNEMVERVEELVKKLK
jgi:hypothetical protein